LRSWRHTNEKLKNGFIHRCQICHFPSAPERLLVAGPPEFLDLDTINTDNTIKAISKGFVNFVYLKICLFSLWQHNGVLQNIEN
jgi:hypothetical protein